MKKSCNHSLFSACYFRFCWQFLLPMSHCLIISSIAGASVLLTPTHLYANELALLGLYHYDHLETSDNYNVQYKKGLAEAADQLNINLIFNNENTHGNAEGQYIDNASGFPVELDITSDIELALSPFHDRLLQQEGLPIVVFSNLHTTSSRHHALELELAKLYPNLKIILMFRPRGYPKFLIAVEQALDALYPIAATIILNDRKQDILDPIINKVHKIYKKHHLEHHPLIIVMGWHDSIKNALTRGDISAALEGFPKEKGYFTTHYLAKKLGLSNNELPEMPTSYLHLSDTK